MLDPLGFLVSDFVKAELRPHYRPNDHGALVLGPDGNNIEAVRGSR